jgi:hypothetical protein
MTALQIVYYAGLFVGVSGTAAWAYFGFWFLL